MDKKSLEKVYKAGLKLLQPYTLPDLYETICKEAIKIIDGEYASIFLDINGGLVRVYSTTPVLDQIQIRKNGYTYRVFRTQEPKLLAAREIEKIHPEIRQITARSDVIIPLINQKESIGVITVLSSDKVNFTQEDMKMLMLFGPMASLAIKKTQLYEEIKTALQTRDLFISMAAHELRTPLTTINGYTQLLNSKLSKDPDTNESRWAYELMREVTRMKHLINELLEMNRIKSGELDYNFQEYHLKDIVDRVMRNLELVHPHRKFILKDEIREGKDLIIGDFEKIMQVIANLVDNSVKFSPSDTPLEILLGSKSGFLTIDIKDQGKGILNKDLDKIFDGFYRGGNNKVEGMGLGLYLVKNIIEMHRGEVKVSSKVDKGTTFSVLLPIYEHL